jgi:hypothetical protein
MVFLFFEVTKKIYKSCSYQFLATLLNSCHRSNGRWDILKKIQSKEYFSAVQEYFAEQKMPSRVYKFLLDTLREDEYKLSDDLLYCSVDTLETTDDCMRFCAGTDYILVLCKA